MDYSALLRSALVALLRNKMRSMLTVMGITIGIAAVICVVAIGKAGQSRVEQQLNNLGDNLVWIEAGRPPPLMAYAPRHAQDRLPSPWPATAAAIKNQIALIKTVSPNVDDHVQVIYGNQNWFTQYRTAYPRNSLTSSVGMSIRVPPSPMRTSNVPLTSATLASPFVSNSLGRKIPSEKLSA